ISAVGRGGSIQLVLAVLVVVSGFAAAFTFLGWVAGGITVRMGRLGKNRGAAPAALLSVVAALVALGLTFSGWDLLDPLLRDPPWFSDDTRWWFRWVILAGPGPGSAWALIPAGQTGWKGRRAPQALDGRRG